MPIFDELQRASWGGLDFPVRSVSIKGKFRHDDHEYLRVPGAAVEKHARSLYTIDIEASFDRNIRGYGDLWPTVLTVFRQKFERGLTEPLVIPTVGTIPAFLTDWDQFADFSKRRSGETLRMPFKEDRTALFLTEAAAQVSQANLEDASTNFKATAEMFAVPAGDKDLFTAVQNAVNEVLAIKDRGDLQAGLLAARIEQLTAIITETDKVAESLKHPENSPVLEALFALWDATVNMSTNLAESPRGPRIYILPRVMSLSDISFALYGDTAHGGEILMNNHLTDPFAVPAGTQIVYFLG